MIKNIGSLLIDLLFLLSLKTDPFNFHPHTFSCPQAAAENIEATSYPVVSRLVPMPGVPLNFK
jgi:hypothetical protein